MSSREISAEIRIGMVTSNHEDYFELTVLDGASRIEFLSVKLTPEQYAWIATGRQQVVKATIIGQEDIGKDRVSERRQIEAPDSLHYASSGVLSKWLQDNYREEGWNVSTYLGSQGSRTYKDGKLLLNFSVFKFVDNANG